MIFGIKKTEKKENTSLTREGGENNQKLNLIKKYTSRKLKRKTIKEIHPRAPKEVKLLKSIHHALIAPRVTEKAARLNEGGIYVFNVVLSATKNDIRNAIKQYYNVTPTRIRTLKRRSKKVVQRKRTGVVKGTKGAQKIAFVELKKGDKITFT